MLSCIASCQRVDQFVDARTQAKYKFGCAVKTVRIERSAEAVWDAGRIRLQEITFQG